MGTIKDFLRDCYQRLTSANYNMCTRCRWNSRGSAPGGRAGSRHLFRVQIDRLHRQVPMRVEDFEAALFFALERILVGIHLLLQRSLVEGLVGDSGVLEDDGHAEIPAAVFGSVIARLVHPN